MAETETRPETFSLETETRPRHWKIPLRRDRDETLDSLRPDARRFFDRMTNVMQYHIGSKYTVGLTLLFKS